MVGLAFGLCWETRRLDAVKWGVSFPLLFFGWSVRMRAYKYLQSTQEHQRESLRPLSSSSLSTPPPPPPYLTPFPATSPSAWVFVCRCSEHMPNCFPLIYAYSAPAPASLSLSLCSHNLCSLQELIPARDCETAAYLFLWVLAYRTYTHTLGVE